MYSYNKQTNVLIIANPKNVFVKSLIEELVDIQYVNIDVLCISGYYLSDIKLDGKLFFVSRAGVKSKSIIKQYMNNFAYLTVFKDIINNLSKYDVVNIHYVDGIYRYIVNEIRNKENKLHITVRE